MSIPEAIRGAQAELARLPSATAKLRRVVTYARIIGAELLGSLAILPYGFRSFLIHRSLPEARPGERQRSVTLLRGVRYGQKTRNVMDVYLPPDTLLQDLDGVSGDGRTDAAASGGAGCPLMLFCHGGVWATGDKWHYAPMATRLAESGVITAVMQYTLYPQALAPAMAQEVSQALSWTLAHAERLGAAPNSVTLAGHSAGAQLCAMALLHRALGRGGGEEAAEAGHGAGTALDARMPRCFVSMAGVFDIGKHLEYERARDVHELSTMARAVGGASRFAHSSPAVILASALRRKCAPPLGTASGGNGGAVESCSHTATAADSDGAQSAADDGGTQSFYGGFPLRGDAIAHRVGLARRSAPPQRAVAVAAAPAAAAPPIDPEDSILRFSIADAQLLPPTVLQSSSADRIVPWHESAEMHIMLRDCGAPVRSLVYNAAGHGDFVVAWWPTGAVPGAMRGGAQVLPDFAADLLDVVTGKVAV